MKKQVKTRLTEIDIAVGLTMILVVFGHNLFPEAQAVRWYTEARNFIYLFHMPLFMFLSGFIVFISYKPIHSIREYNGYILKKLKKFAPPYFILSSLYISFEVFRNHLSIADVLSLIHDMLFSPIHGAAIFLWYLYVLMIYYLLTPFIIVQSNRVMGILIFFSFILLFIPTTPYFSLEPAGKHLFYFLTGGLLAKNYIEIRPYLRKAGPFALLLLILSFLIYLTHRFDIPSPLIAITAIISIYYFSTLSFLQKANIISQIGFYTYQIYLLNSLVIGTLYLGFTYFHLFEKIPFWGFLITGALSGLVVPVVLTKIYSSLFPLKRNA